MVTFAVPDLPLGAGVDDDGDTIMTSPLPSPIRLSPPPPPSTSFSSPPWWDVGGAWARLAGLVARVVSIPSPFLAQDSEDGPRSDTIDTVDASPSSTDNVAALPPLEAPFSHPPFGELVRDGYAPGRVYVGVGGRPRLPIDIKLGKRVRFADDDGTDANPQSPKKRRKSRAIKKEFGIKTGLLRGSSPPKQPVYQGPSMAYLAAKDAALDAQPGRVPLGNNNNSNNNNNNSNTDKRPEPDFARRRGSLAAYSRLGEVLADLPLGLDERESEDEFGKAASALAERRTRREKAEGEAASRRKAEQRRAREDMARRRAIITDNNPLPLATMFDAAPRRSSMSPPPRPERPELTLCTPTSPLPANGGAAAAPDLPEKSTPSWPVLPPPAELNLSPESLPAESDGEHASPATPPPKTNHPGHAPVTNVTNTQLFKPATIYQSIEVATETETATQSEDMARCTLKLARKACRLPADKGGHGGKENDVASKRARRSLGRTSASPGRASLGRASSARRSQRATRSPEANGKMGFLDRPPRRSRRLRPVV